MESGGEEVITGTVIGSHHVPMQWIKQRYLGEGSHGFVDLAKILLPIPCICAVKYSAWPNLSLAKEYRVLQKFRHCQNIVQYHTAAWSVEYEILNFNLFMEYASGGNLLHLMRKYGGKIPEPYVKFYTRMLLEGLRVIHGKGYIHSDLKPANILVFPPDDQHSSISTLKIADFGLAMEPGEIYVQKVRTSNGASFPGAAPYMSPESVRDGKVTAALDIWSLGCVVAEMLTGEPPWGEFATSLEDLERMIVSTENLPYELKTLSHAGQHFLMKCFERDPQKRWTADTLMRHPFLLHEADHSTALAPQTRFPQVGLAKGLPRRPVFYR